MRLLAPFRSRAIGPTLPGLASTTVHNSGMATTPLLGPIEQYLSSSYTSTDPVPTEAGVLGLPAAWRAIQLVANGVAVMMVSANVMDTDGRELDTPRLVARPNINYGSYEYWYEAVATVLMHGNYVAVVEGDQVIPVHPANVSCKVADNGSTVYKIGNDNYYVNVAGMPPEVLHVRGLTMPGDRWGLGVIESLRKSMVGSIDLQNYANNTFRTGGMPTVGIKMAEKQITVEQANLIASQFTTTFGAGQRKPIAYAQGMEITPFSWSPVDAQFLQNVALNVALIAFAFGLDPSDLSSTVSTSGATMTYSNIEQRNIERISSSYGPWLVRFEQAFSDLLPEGQHVVGNPAALLRTDMATRLDAYERGLAMGLWTRDYVQDKENIPEHYRPTLKEAA